MLLSCALQTPEQYLLHCQEVAVACVEEHTVSTWRDPNAGPAALPDWVWIVVTTPLGAVAFLINNVIPPGDQGHSGGPGQHLVWAGRPFVGKPGLMEELKAISEPNVASEHVSAQVRSSFALVTILKRYRKRGVPYHNNTIQ